MNNQDLINKHNWLHSKLGQEFGELERECIQAIRTLDSEQLLSIAQRLNIDTEKVLQTRLDIQNIEIDLGIL